MLMNNDDLFKRIDNEMPGMAEAVNNELIMEPFYQDFTRRFCWNSNSIEGNTLSLEETISLLDSLLVFVICKGELAALERVKELERKLKRTIS